MATIHEPVTVSTVVSYVAIVMEYLAGIMLVVDIF
jgi:hypothetical protein